MVAQTGSDVGEGWPEIVARKQGAERTRGLWLELVVVILAYGPSS